MCSQYRVQFDPRDIDDFYFSKADLALGEARLVTPQSPAPVLVSKEGVLQLELMRFGLLPQWSMEPRVKFSTHNARLDTVESKASFSDAFTKRHCLVPITSFIEALYQGDLAGNMVGFRAENELLMAAGIWEEWQPPQGGEKVRSFSILTDEPYPFVLKNGHDRSPLIVNKSYWQQWLQGKGIKPEQLKAELRRHRREPLLKTEIERPLKAGWEKRI